MHIRTLRVLLPVVAASALLVAVGCTPTTPEPRVALATRVTDLEGRQAAEVAKQLGVTKGREYFEGVILPRPMTDDPRPTLSIVRWREYERARVAGSLGVYRPANMTELFAFLREHSSVLKTPAPGYLGLCAPVKFFPKGERTPSYAVISSGDRLGVWSTECSWALVVDESNGSLAPKTDSHAS